MKKTDYHVYQVAFIYPLLNGLKKSGVALDSIRSKSSIRMFDFYNPAAYLPIGVLHEFIQNVQADQNVENMAMTFYSDFELSELGEYGEFLSQCPDLLTMLLEAIKYEQVAQTNLRMKLDIQGPVSRFSQYRLDPPSRGRQLSEEIEFVLMLQAFKMVLGKDWKPLSIQLTNNSAKNINSFIPLFEDVAVQFGCPCQGFTFKTEALAQINRIKSSQSTPPNINFDTFTEKVVRVLCGSKDGHILTLNEFSDYFGGTRRTIIRNLLKEGTSYSSLLQRHLFKKSIKLLKNESLSIYEIGQIMGYSNAPNFVRAFNTTLSL